MGLANDTKLTPLLYDVFLSYKKATTTVERWLAATSRQADSTIRLTIREMQQAADVIKSKGVKVPDNIYYAFDKAIEARSEVTAHFKNWAVSGQDEENTASHQFFTNT